MCHPVFMVVLTTYLVRSDKIKAHALKITTISLHYDYTQYFLTPIRLDTIKILDLVEIYRLQFKN